MGGRKAAGAKVPVTVRAVTQRINRALRARGETLKAARGVRARQDLGDYYTIQVDRNAVVDTHVDLERLARELGALAPYEQVVSDEG